MRKKILPVQISIALIVTATVGALTVWAGTFTAGPLVQVSSTSPFGPLANCGNFPGDPTGTFFLDSEVEPWVEVNPTNPNNIVAFWQQDRWSNGGARSNVAGVSFDGGTSWQIVVVPGLSDCSGGEFERASDPWLSFSPDGTLHQVTLVTDASPPPDRPAGFGRNGLVVSKSEDGGLTWSDPIIIVEDNDPRILNDKESITADPTDPNLVYVVWDRFELSEATVIAPENLGPGLFLGVGLGFKSPFYFARSTDAGETWERPRVIYDPGGNNQTIGHQIVVLPNGTLVDLFAEFLNVRNDDGGGTQELHLSLLRSPNKGRSWQPVDGPSGRPIRTNSLTPRGVLTPDDGMTVRDAANLFDVAVDPSNGTLYAVWQDARFSGFDEIAFSQSTDGGFTWSAPIKVNQTPTNIGPARRQAFIPSVAVNGNGTVAVTYYDFRNDDNSGELADHFAVHCHEGCSNSAHWGDEIRLTDTSFDYLQAPVARGLFLGDYMGLASDGTDFVAFFQQSSSLDHANGFFRRFGP